MRETLTSFSSVQRGVTTRFAAAGKCCQSTSVAKSARRAASATRGVSSWPRAASPGSVRRRRLGQAVCQVAGVSIWAMLPRQMIFVPGPRARDEGLHLLRAQVLRLVDDDELLEEGARPRMKLIDLMRDAGLDEVERRLPDPSRRPCCFPSGRSTSRLSSSAPIDAPTSSSVRAGSRCPLADADGRARHTMISENRRSSIVWLGRRKGHQGLARARLAEQRYEVDLGIGEGEVQRSRSVRCCAHAAPRPQVREPRAQADRDRVGLDARDDGLLIVRTRRRRSGRPPSSRSERRRAVVPPGT